MFIWVYRVSMALMRISMLKLFYRPVRSHEGFPMSFLDQKWGLPMLTMMVWRQILYALISVLHYQWFDKKQIVYPKWWYGEKTYMPLNYSIHIHDLTHTLCLILWKKFTTKFLVKYTPFHKKCHIVPKMTHPWNALLVISSPEYILTYANKERFYFSCSLKKLHDLFFIFDKKNYFFTQNDGIVKCFIWP